VNAGRASELVRETAAAWHDRLQRERVSEDTRRAFTQWLAESPEHRRAYEAIDRTWSALRARAREPEILALRHEAALRLTRDTSRSLRPMRWVAVALAIGVLAAIVVSLPRDERSLKAWIFETYLSTNRTYATTVGERLVVALTDGSQVTLDTQSELQVAFSKQERRVRVTRGQALFEVAKDRARPFAVEVRNRRFVAVGTTFGVRVDDTQIQVTMVEGTVRVERTTDASPGPARAEESNHSRRGSEGPGMAQTTAGARTALLPAVTTLTTGEQLVVDAQSEDHVHPVDPDQVTSWRRGQIIFDNTRLGDAVAELNRYSDTKVELADPALADLRLSGAFATGRSNLFVEAVTSYFPVAVASSDARAVVLKAR